MPKLVPISGKKLCKMIEKLGFIPIQGKGSHIRFKHPDGRATVVPVHHGRDIGRGLLKKILNEIEVNRDEFMRYL